MAYSAQTRVNSSSWGFAEKWRVRLRLLFSGCKVKNFPKWATLDKYDLFSLVVAQTRIVLAAAKLGDRR
jgi:hypothetical protein